MNEIDGSATLLEVCAVVNVGTLRRDIIVTLISMDDSATSTGMKKRYVLLLAEWLG